MLIEIDTECITIELFRLDYDEDLRFSSAKAGHVANLIDGTFCFKVFFSVVEQRYVKSILTQRKYTWIGDYEYIPDSIIIDEWSGRIFLWSWLSISQADEAADVHVDSLGKEEKEGKEFLVPRQSFSCSQ